MKKSKSEGLRIARLLMVFSSISPLFILWAIRGNNLVKDSYFFAVCAVLVLLPNFVLLLRIAIAKRNNDRREIFVGTADDHRDHILVYLLSIFLPFYSEDVTTTRDLIATVTAVLFCIFLFWHLNLHYLNIGFAIFGYRVFTVHSPADGNPLTGQVRYVVITNRDSLSAADTISTYRLSDTVYLEAK